ncbi:MAG: malto-oligosyltrehalose trehalohydrolase [Gemmatimonadaceae bacterium]
MPPLQRGATLIAPDATRFSLWAPNAPRVAVRVHDGPAAGDHSLDARGGGVYEATVAGVTAGARYSYRLGGEARDYPDPVSRAQPDGVHGASQVVDPAAFAWSDAAWRGREMADLVISELHVGTFSDAGTFDAAIPFLAELRDVGVTAIEIMPVAEFPGTRNWGYDGVHPYAPQSSYGGADGLRRLVDAAHDRGLAVVLDVVYNHLGPEGNYLGAFGPYFSETYRTPWGHAMNFDGAHSDEVRRYFIDNTLYWITEFHVDALRLDAVHAIFDFGARHLLVELAAAVHAHGDALGRRVLVIGESDLNDPRLLHAPERGGYGLDGQWSDDFHHAVHVALTGEARGYYEDFADETPVANVAKALRDRFVRDGAYSMHRKRRHGAPPADVSADHFVIALQNHDQVGNRAVGDRLSTLVPFDKLRVGAALLLLSPYVPLLFMGEEYAERNPFLYFVSHGDESLVERVRRGRRAEFEAFGWEPADIPDPQSEETFVRSKLNRATRSRPEHAGVLALHRDLLRIRRDEPALRPGDATLDVTGDGRDGWIATRLSSPRGATLLSLFNLSDKPRVARLPDPPHRWHRLLSTDDERYGGRGITSAAPAVAGSFTIAPWSATLHRQGGA